MRGASRAPGPVPPRNRLCGLDKLRNPPCLTFLIRGTKEEVTAAIRTERVAHGRCSALRCWGAALSAPVAGVAWEEAGSGRLSGDGGER